MKKEDLEALVETKKGELEDVQMPANQEGMPAYHSQRLGIYTDLAAMYDALGMQAAKELAEASARAEERSAAAWSKSLNQAAGLNNGSNLEGGYRRRRKSRKQRRQQKKRKYSRRR